MTPVIWTPAALRDVARLYAFLAPKNREAAQRAVRAIRQSVKSLRAHPEIGRAVEEMPPEFRQRFVRFGNGGYVVLYWYDGDLIAILGCQDLRIFGSGG